MRTSTYEAVFPLIDESGALVEGYALLFNGIYGAMDIVKEPDAAKVASGSSDSLSPELRRRLLARGHLTQKDEMGEVADMKLLARVNRMLTDNSGTLFLLPTYNCNFRCTYCYERRRLAKGREWLSHTMSPEMIDAVFKAVDRFRDQGRRIDRCVLFGGEPFLKANLPVVREMVEHAEARGMQLVASTNGYDLENFLPLLSQHPFRLLQISVDGTQKEHDRLRVREDGTGSYERILGNIDLALRQGVNVKLRMNVDKGNLGSISGLLEDIRTRGWMEAGRFAGRFSYHFGKLGFTGCKANEATNAEIVEELRRLGFGTSQAIDLERYHSSIAKILRDYLSKTTYPRAESSHCGASQWNLFVDPFGDVYPCGTTLALEDEAVGFVDEGSGRFLWNLNRPKWRLRTSDRIEACRTCPYVFVCRGGCAKEASMYHGDYFRECCDEAKDVIAFVISRIAGEAWEHGHEAELSLSWTDFLSRLTPQQRETLERSNDRGELLDIVKAVGIAP